MTGHQMSPWMFPDLVQPDARMVIYMYYLKATGKTNASYFPTPNKLVFFLSLSLSLMYTHILHTLSLSLSIVKAQRQYGIMIGIEGFNSGSLCLIFTLPLDLRDLGQAT